MKNAVKSELLNDVLTGLLVAATFAIAMPGDALAQQTLANVASASHDQVGKPFATVVGYISYAMGTVMTVAGIAGAKKHADNPGSNPLGPALGKLGAGAAFLVAPSVIGTLTGTGNNLFGGVNNGVNTGTTIQF